MWTLDVSSSLRFVVAWLVAVFVFTIPLEELVTIPGLGSITRIVGLATIPLALVALIDRGRVRVRMPTLFLLASAAFVAWNVVSVFWSRSPGTSLGIGITFVQLFVFVWLVSEFCRGPEPLARLMQAFVLGNYAALGIAMFLLFQTTGFARETGRDPNEFATVLAWGIPLAAWLVARQRRGLLYLLNLVYPVFAVFGLVLSASRGGLLVALVALLAIPFMITGLGIVKRLALVGIVSVGVVVTVDVAPQLFPHLQGNIDRLGETSEELTDGTLTGRTLIWAESIKIIQSSPIVGVGAGAARKLYAETLLGRERVAHNVFLQIATDTGLMGLLLFIAMIVVAAAGLLGMDRPFRPYAVILLAAVIVGMAPLSIDMRKYLWFGLVLLANQAPFVVSIARPRWSALRGGNGRPEMGDGLDTHAA